MNEVYCIHNAPRQNGDLWIKVIGDTVKVMNPAGIFWRNKTFTIQEFRQIFKKLNNEPSKSKKVVTNRSSAL
jgi:hypothetical protein